ncbi:MAG TPA: preprotein translocase subunit SecE [Alphaproteobacteria bacterium]|nr:preprotein translocase subunit SecE [Alphaproteobacteria bacterium]
MSKAVTVAQSEQSPLERLKTFPARTKGFLSDVRNEMRKVTHPSQKEVRATTFVVIITVIVFAIYFFLVDQGISRAVTWIMSRGAR